MTGSEKTDHELLASWSAGEDAAGTLLVRRHFESLSRFFRARAADHRVDLMQKTWLGCVESRERVPADLPFKAYLMGIARRVLIHHFREHKRSAHVGPERADSPHPGTSPTGVLAMADEEKVLLQAMRRLPLDMQLTLELFYWEGLAVAEIGHVLEVPAGTIKSRLHRARGLLKERIDTLEPAPELAQSTAANLDVWAKSIRRFLGRGHESSS